MKNFRSLFHAVFSCFLKNDLHSYFLRLQTTGLIEVHGAFVAAPYVKCQVIAAMFPCKIQSSLIKHPPNMMARLESMWEHREALEKDIKYRPDPATPDMTRSEKIMAVLYAISL